MDKWIFYGLHIYFQESIMFCSSYVTWIFGCQQTHQTQSWGRDTCKFSQECHKKVRQIMFYLNSFKCCHGSRDSRRNTLTFVFKERTFYGFSEIFISNIFDIHHNGNSLGDTASHNFCHHGATPPEYWLHRQHHIYKLQLSWTFHILAFESADEKVSRLGTLWLGKGKYNSEY